MNGDMTGTDSEETKLCLNAECKRKNIQTCQTLDSMITDALAHDWDTILGGLNVAYNLSCWWSFFCSRQKWSKICCAVLIGGWIEQHRESDMLVLSCEQTSRYLKGFWDVKICFHWVGMGRWCLDLGDLLLVLTSAPFSPWTWLGKINEWDEIEGFIFDSEQIWMICRMRVWDMWGWSQPNSRVTRLRSCWCLVWLPTWLWMKSSKMQYWEPENTQNIENRSGGKEQRCGYASGSWEYI